MEGILKEIVDHTWRRVRVRRAKTTLSALRALPLYDRAVVSFEAALRHDDLAVIAEIKRRSPSKGALRPELDVGLIASGYQRAGAAAVSVLTEPDYFGGSLDDLGEARRSVALPLLRKDFIVDPWQVFEARAAGADAVLLIVAALSESQLSELLHVAKETRLAALVEVHDPRELDRMDVSRIRILGVNNRDLRTFEVDLQQSLDVFRIVPDHIVRVSESGLSNPADLVRVRNAGADAVLIGEAFMSASDPEVALKTLLTDYGKLLNSVAQTDEHATRD